MIDHGHIAKTLAAYLARHPGEADRLAPIGAALAGAGDVTSRSTFTGHLTCSAIVVNPDGLVLHIRHRVLGKWLGPGGHLEARDTSLVDAAVREVEEETGIADDLLTLADDIPADIGVYLIPANPGRGEPQHNHFDLRFLFTVPAGVEVRLQAEEVDDCAWLPLIGLEPAHLPARVAAMLR
ncbi:NUDIX hydrolase [Catellatospora sp. NPDC049133]|uniref:NUDIX hydrolase n=1 Tax=Catellatospora sp. NPDC049133 TaxID=3155499 RepID=UPI0033DBCC39